MNCSARVRGDTFAVRPVLPRSASRADDLHPHGLRGPRGNRERRQVPVPRSARGQRRTRALSSPAQPSRAQPGRSGEAAATCGSCRASAARPAAASHRTSPRHARGRTSARSQTWIVGSAHGWATHATRAPSNAQPNSVRPESWDRRAWPSTVARRCRRARSRSSGRCHRREMPRTASRSAGDPQRVRNSSACPTGADAGRPGAGPGPAIARSTRASRPRPDPTSSDERTQVHVADAADLRARAPVHDAQMVGAGRSPRTAPRPPRAVPPTRSRRAVRQIDHCAGPARQTGRRAARSRRFRAGSGQGSNGVAAPVVQVDPQRVVGRPFARAGRGPAHEPLHQRDAGRPRPGRARAWSASTGRRQRGQLAPRLPASPPPRQPAPALLEPHHLIALRARRCCRTRIRGHDGGCGTENERLGGSGRRAGCARKDGAHACFVPLPMRLKPEWLG